MALLSSFVHNLLINKVHHFLVANLVKIDSIDCFALKTFIGKIVSVS